MRGRERRGIWESGAASARDGLLLVGNWLWDLHRNTVVSST